MRAGLFLIPQILSDPFTVCGTDAGRGIGTLPESSIGAHGTQIIGDPLPGGRRCAGNSALFGTRRAERAGEHRRA
jgi:hypothetical protein